MRVFVTGGAGFLGSHICDQFDDVVAVDNMMGGERDNVPSHVEFHEANCLDDLSGHMEGCDVVYHTACFPHEGLSVFSPKIVTESVFGVSASIFTAAINAGVKRVIFCSSMARYGSQQAPFVETYPTKPQDPYGIAKAASEELLANLSEVHGIEYSIAVPHNIVGPRQKYDDPFRNVVAIMVNRVLSGKPPIVYGDGTQKRCFSHVNDVLSCLVKMIEIPSGEVVNVGPDEGAVTLNYLAFLIINVLGTSLKPIYVGGRPQEVKHAVCSSDKAREMLGYRTKHTLEEAIIDLADHIKERGIRPFTYHLPIEIESERIPVTWRDRIF